MGDGAGARQPRIAEIDGWRGVSILCVVIGHLINIRYAAPDTDPTNLAGVMATWGVRIFFIVSGFIISRLAIDEFAARGHFSILQFYGRRIFRIIPAFYFYLFCLALFSCLGLINQPLDRTAWALTFTCNLPHVPCDWFAGHTWTLAYEEQFYLTFPVIFYVAGRNSPRILLSILTALVIFPFICFGLHLRGAWHVASGMCSSFSFICVGAVAAAYEARLRELATGPANTFISAACAMVLIVMATVSSVVALPLGSPPAYVQAALTNVLLPPCLAWTVLSQVFREGRLGWLLRSRITQFFGLISYSLYLWQEAFTGNLIAYPMKSWLLFPPLMLVPAMLSYYCLERPCIRAGRKLLQRNRRMPVRDSVQDEAAIAGGA